jgi:hypothetical protein
MSQHANPGRPTSGQPGPGQPQPAAKRSARAFKNLMRDPVVRKRDRIRAEVARNRKGDHLVPTWVLAVVLGVLVAGWLFLVFTS